MADSVVEWAVAQAEAMLAAILGSTAEQPVVILEVFTRAELLASTGQVVPAVAGVATALAQALVVCPVPSDLSMVETVGAATAPTWDSGDLAVSTVKHLSMAAVLVATMLSRRP